MNAPDAAPAPRYVRHCPGCGQTHPPERLRCTCGVMLTGVDLSPVAPAPLPASAPAPAPTPAPTGVPSAPASGGPASEAAPWSCPFEDCGQPNPPGTVLCLYCNRPLHLPGATPADPAVPNPPLADVPALLQQLPQALRERYRIQRQLPASGAEAELFIVQTQSGVEPARVAKVYRHGILPKPEVQARLARVSDAHKVQVLETGVSDGFAYELMEFCAAGSLRQRLQAGRLAAPELAALIAGLAGALAAVHAQQLIHRDLKPENLLLRRSEPLEVVLTDFGIASVQDATLRFTTSTRTLAYGAPECLAGVLDAKADYWAMGMIVLEAAQGEHPFAGLSEAVLLHRLTTRPIDLGAVRDERLRMLLRGLLLRDPQARWGAPEVARWLAADPTLAEPVEQGGELGARQPYRLGDDECYTADQLAVALARHWPQAVADLDNGLLMTWLREQLQDHNAVRRLIDLNEARHLSRDARLLHLLLHLAPGLPPVWRGQALSIGTVLGLAGRTLKGESAAAERLLELHHQRVVAAYAQAGHPELADLHQRWQTAHDAFETEWQTAQAVLARQPAPRTERSWDEAVYGAHTAVRRPLPELLHARLLALSFDAAWTARLRRHLALELQRLQPAAPWLAELGDARQCDAPRLLVLHALLPEAQRWLELARRVQEEAQQQRHRQVQDLQSQTVLLQQAVRSAATPVVFDAAACDALAQALHAYAEHTVQVSALGWPDEGLQRLRQRLLRHQDETLRLRRLTDELATRRVANRGWFSPWMGLAVLMLSITAANLVGRGAAQFVLLLALGMVAWRWWPTWGVARRIREEGGRFSG